MKVFSKPRLAVRRPRRLGFYRPEVHVFEARQQAGSLLPGPWGALMGSSLPDFSLRASHQSLEAAANRIWQDSSAPAVALSSADSSGSNLVSAQTDATVYTVGVKSAVPANRNDVGPGATPGAAQGATNELIPLKELKEAASAGQIQPWHLPDLNLPRAEASGNSEPVTAPSTSATFSQAAPVAAAPISNTATEAELSAYTVSGIAQAAPSPLLAKAGDFTTPAPEGNSSIGSALSGSSLPVDPFGSADRNPELHPGTATGLHNVPLSFSTTTHVCDAPVSKKGPASPPPAALPGGQSVVFSTFHGDTGQDEGNSVDVDTSGNIEVVGTSTDASGAEKGFITTIAPDGSNCVTTDYTGDGGAPGGFNRIVVHAIRSGFLVGDFVHAFTGRTDGFIAKFNPITHQFDVFGFGTFNGDTSAWDAGFDAFGRIYVTGWTTVNGRRNVFLDRLDFATRTEAFFIWDLRVPPGTGGLADSCGTGLHIVQDPRNPANFHVDIVGVIRARSSGVQQSFVLCVDARDVNPFNWVIRIDHRAAPDLSFGAFRVRWERDIFGGFHLVFYVVANRVNCCTPGAGTEELIKYEAQDGALVQDWDRSYAGRVVTAVAEGDSGNLYTAGSIGSNAFVDVYSPDGSQLLDERLLGGNGSAPSSAQDVIEVDGSIYVTGWTRAADFAPIVNACQPTFSGGEDAFITKINAAFEPQAIQVQGPASVTAGQPFNVTITVRDQNGNPVLGYAGDVHFSSSDSSATLPSDYVFNANDPGSHTFTGVVLRTPGSQTITATDMLDPALSGTATITVLQSQGNLVTRRGDLMSNDFIDWGNLGPANTLVPNPSTAVSAMGTTATVSEAPTGPFQRLDQTSDGATPWIGNFAPGDHLLYTNASYGGGNGPITIDFGARTVSGIGAQIQANYYGDFLARISTFDASGNLLASFTENGTSNNNADNSAIFIGVQSSTCNISKIVFSLDSAFADPTDFAINKLDFSNCVPGVPSNQANGLDASRMGRLTLAPSASNFGAAPTFNSGIDNTASAGGALPDRFVFPTEFGHSTPLRADLFFAATAEEGQGVAEAGRRVRHRSALAEGWEDLTGIEPAGLLNLADPLMPTLERVA